MHAPSRASFYADTATLVASVARIVVERALPAYLFLVIAVSSSLASVCLGLDLRARNGTGWDGDVVLGRRCPRPPFARSAQTWTHTVEGSSMPALLVLPAFLAFFLFFSLASVFPGLEFLSPLLPSEWDGMGW
ncbi:hypothetical protein C8R45DRAFT_1004659 [Mycena sanguinolenta]|nr:hypothetical protein C8R45DRAFT_1004659 [Mycena sanguinolenta]